MSFISRKLCSSISENLISTEIIDQRPLVLLVEDNPMVQFITKELLNSTGFSVDIASSGQEALEKMIPNKYEMIYMDIGLPDMAGHEVVNVMREKEREAGIVLPVPIIVLTGHGTVDIKEFCRDAEIQGVLSKPIVRDQIKALWQYLKQNPSVLVPGLTLLKPNPLKVCLSDVLDVLGTVKIIGSEEGALTLIRALVEDLKRSFLGQIKEALLENKTEELRFLLHRQLGALAYAKAPKLEKHLLDLQKKIKEGVNIDRLAFYQDIEKAFFEVLACYEKINSMNKASPF